MTNEQLMERIALLEGKVSKLESRVGRLEKERDEARKNFVLSAIGKVIRERNLYHRFGAWLRSDAIVAIKQGRMTTAEAIAERNEQWPMFDSAVGLADSYRAALEV